MADCQGYTPRPEPWECPFHRSGVVQLRRHHVDAECRPGQVAAPFQFALITIFSLGPPGLAEVQCLLDVIQGKNSIDHGLMTPSSTNAPIGASCSPLAHMKKTSDLTPSSSALPLVSPGAMTET